MWYTVKQIYDKDLLPEIKRDTFYRILKRGGCRSCNAGAGLTRQHYIVSEKDLRVFRVKYGLGASPHQTKQVSAPSKRS